MFTNEGYPKFQLEFHFTEETCKFTCIGNYLLGMNAMGLLKQVHRSLFDSQEKR